MSKVAMSTDSAQIRKDGSRFKKLLIAVWKHRFYYLILLPLIAWYIIMCYVPMYGLQLAFKDYKFNLGITGSPWNNFAHFKALWQDAEFWSAFRNTLIISLGKLVFHFPLPIILAIVMSELSNPKLSRFFQSVFTFPHLISWVVLAGIVTNLFSNSGAINQILVALGFDAFSPLTSTKYFRPMLYITHIWKEIGWDSIIYMAALTGISSELNEAAVIDGANRFQRKWHISLPGIKNIICILLILQIGNTMGIGSSFDQVFNLYSAPVYSVADTIDTFIYRKTFAVGCNFGYTTAVGMLKSVINVILIVAANSIAKKMGEEGLY